MSVLRKKYRLVREEASEQKHGGEGAGDEIKYAFLWGKHREIFSEVQEDEKL